MIAIVLVDDNGGMAFNGRRQSMDRNLTRYLMEKRVLPDGKKMMMREVSLPLFTGYEENIEKVYDFSGAGQSDYCFIEDTKIENYARKIEKVIVCRWNRVYPADTYLTFDLNSLVLMESEDIEGSSHERITVETYERRGEES